MSQNAKCLRYSCLKLSVVSLVMFLFLLFAGCTVPKKDNPQTSVIPQPPPEIVIGTMQRPQYLDPAAPSTAVGDLVSLSVFQRLLSYHQDGALKPDAAKDCAFTKETTYRCILRDGLVFQNGDFVTAKDVEFSILRAKHLAAPGAEIFEVLQKISTPDTKTIEFSLAFPDTDFGKYLAMPSLSIVPEKIYSDKELRSITALPVGSGVFEVTSMNQYSMRFVRAPKYQGDNKAAEGSIKLKFFQGYQDAELALKNADVDILWQGLDSSAQKRLADARESNISTSAKYDLDNREIGNYYRVELAGVKELKTRKMLALAWQRQRTWLSLLPQGISEYKPVFAAGGHPALEKEKVSLRLSYNSVDYGAKDIALSLALQAQESIEISVLADDPQAELQLRVRPAPIFDSSFWLSYYLRHSEVAEVKKLSKQLHTTYDANERREIVSAIEVQAVKELLEIPVAVSDNPIYRQSSVRIDADSFGPGRQFTLWGVHR